MMKLDYHLTLDHFLEHQLYASNQSASVQKKRQNSRIILAAAYVLLGLIMLSISDRTVLGVVFIVLGLGWFLFYPNYSKWRYKRHYERYIKEHYQSRINVPIELEIHPDYLLSKDKTGESRVNKDEIEALIYLPNIYLIKMKSGVSFIIPQDSVIDQEKWKETFQQIGIEIKDETAWEWK